MSEAIKRSWRPGVMAWLIIGGLVLINVAVFFSPQGDDIFFVQRLLHHSDFRQWPDWYGIIFWVIATGTVLHAVNRRYFKWIVASGLLVTMSIVVAYADLFEWLRSVIAFPFFKSYRWSHDLYHEYCYTPMTQFWADGAISWKLFVTPATVIIVIVFLFCVQRYFRRREYDSGSTKLEG